jgi:hypothetical protein
LNQLETFGGSGQTHDMTCGPGFLGITNRAPHPMSGFEQLFDDV